AVALLYVPWLIVAAATLTGYGGNGTSPGAWRALQDAVGAFGVGTTFTGRPLLFWTAVALLLLGIGMWRLARGGDAQRRAAVFLLLYLGVPLAATWLSAQQRPIFDARYLVAAAPPFYLLAAAAVGETADRGWNRRTPLQFTSVTLLVLLLLGGVLGLQRHYVDPAFSKTRGWRELATSIDAMAAGLPPAQVRIAQNFPDPTLWYYYRGPVAHVVLPPAPHDADGAAATLAESAAADVRRVILPQQPAPGWDDADIARGALAASVYTEVTTRDVGVWPLFLYAGAPEDVPDARVDAAFVNGVTLDGAANLPDALVGGGYLTPTLFWTLPGTDAVSGDVNLADVKVSLQLLGPDGALLAQDDRPLLAQGRVDAAPHVTSYGLALPNVLAPGDYRLAAILYDATRADNARIATAAGADQVTLAQFTVAPRDGAAEEEER
ncbi:MAG: hypothetical protein KDE20_03525, partial [Caldilineaceae bacterium]|nr:hypothetical protein [Caldilineaceae bacterium]